MRTLSSIHKYKDNGTPKKFLPKDSFHMTVLPWCREIDRNTDEWPGDIARDVYFTEIDMILKKKIDSLLLLAPVHMDLV